MFSHSVVSDSFAIPCKSPSGSVHGILQARILEWVAISSASPGDLSRMCLLHSCTDRQILYRKATREAQSGNKNSVFLFPKNKRQNKQKNPPSQIFFMWLKFDLGTYLHHLITYFWFCGFMLGIWYQTPAGNSGLFAYLQWPCLKVIRLHRFSWLNFRLKC